MNEWLMEALRLTAAVQGLYVACQLWVVKDHDVILLATGSHELGRTWHRQRWRQKAVTVAGTMIPLILHPAPVSWQTALVVGAYAHLSLWFWWTIFDVSLNRRRRLSLFSIGKSAGSDLWLRKVQERYGWSNQYTQNRVKLPALILATILLLGALTLRIYTAT